MNKKIEQKEQQADICCGQEELRYWLAVHRAPGLNGSHFLGEQPIITNPEDLFGKTENCRWPDHLNTTLSKRLHGTDWQAVEKDLAWIDSIQKHIVTIHDQRYPFLLQQISDPPVVLFVHGNPDILSSLQLAIVGSRNPTPGGVDAARNFGYSLSAAGLTLTSGMALGIDAAGHQGALACSGKTIAVAGTGLNHVYPRCHKQLAEQIAETGAVVSEFPPDFPPRRNHFPRRNRIISGLSLGTLVVEAGISSGSLITARLAAQYGREVFAIPGSIHNPLARGCHALIRDGAKLVETIDDIFEELPALAGSAAADVFQGSAESPQNDLDREQQTVLDCVTSGPLAVDTIVEQSGLAAETVSQILLALELLGHVSSAPGGLYSRINKRT